MVYMKKISLFFFALIASTLQAQAPIQHDGYTKSVEPAVALSEASSTSSMRTMQLELDRQARNLQIFNESLAFIEKHALHSFQVELYLGEPLLESASHSRLLPEIRFANCSTFEAAQSLVEEGFKPLVLDMANPSKPGGSVQEGRGTQEETLCMQSNLYLALKNAEEQAYFPLPDHGGVLLKNITFFRDDHFEFLNSPIQVDVFASAAYDCNRTHQADAKKQLIGYDRPENEAEYREGTKAKMRAMLRAAKMNGNDALVLGAFGCGAFRNDPLQLAMWYKDVLSEVEFHNAFNRVLFGIKTKAGDVNLVTFKSVFESMATYSVQEELMHASTNLETIFFYNENAPVTQWLGNFYPTQVKYNDCIFNNSEAAFQAQKFIEHPDLMSQFIPLRGDAAFRKARELASFIRSDWLKVNVSIMKEILQAKVQQNAFLGDWLDATGQSALVEHNPVKGRDAFWSDDHDGTGRNMLGKLWMEIRAERRNSLL